MSFGTIASAKKPSFNATAEVSSWVRGLHLHPCFVYACIKGSG